MRALVLLASLAVAGSPIVAHAQRAPAQSDAEVIAAIIQASAETYPGNCRCPENVDRAGRRCGARSAHSRVAGQKPFCYASDLTPDLISAWRRGDRGFLRALGR